MNKLKFLFASMLILMASAGFSQVKIGYTNIELLMAYMPEAKVVDSQLQTYQQKLAEQLKIKEDYAKTKLDEYLKCKENNTCSPAQLAEKEKELLELDEELSKLAQDLEFQLMARRQELLEPVEKKLKGAIDEVAKEAGYTIILNQTTSGGVSTILFGPEENDVTDLLAKKLNITLPTE